ncbi:glycosyltransferase family 9 protein [Candidatus Latescibacterota bacterium]
MKVLLIRSGGLGDCILTLTVARVLRDMKPDASLHILGNAAMLDVARLTKAFGSYHSLDTAGFSSLYGHSGATPFLRDFFSSFDEVYFFTSAPKESIQHIVEQSGAGICHVLNPQPPENWRDHAAQHLLRIVGGENTQPHQPVFPSLRQPQPAKVENLLVIHPGSGGVLKNWPVDRFITVADTWRGEVLFALGPAELERGYEDEIPSRFTVAAPKTILEMADAIASASVYLGNDSGASHLASLCRTRSIVLFGSTDPDVWRPLGDEVTVLISSDGVMEGIHTAQVIDTLEMVWPLS